MKSISFFNNKGGVGKTTLTENIAAYFALEKKQRVLIIDCDPQCNITQLVLGDIKTIDLYWPEKNNKEETKSKTILDVVDPILSGDADINSRIRPLRSSSNRFGVDLLPGHPRFSTFEDELSGSWAELPTGKAGGFRVTNWLRSYLRGLEEDYDIVFIDVSPSLGALNRSVLLCSDYFVVPLGADAFSVLGIRNISRWMSSWIDYYEVGLEQSDRLNPGGLEKYSIMTDISIKRGFIGFTLQQYIAKAKAGVRRPTKAYERILNDIPREIDTYLSSFVANNMATPHLGDVPNLYSLIPMAQSANAPIIALESKDGLVGSQFGQAARYRNIIGELAETIGERV
ncbi:ParA family protein [Minwuia thermotolerans]|uniref:Helicase DnaB n=1 Tax=Minwuia thermotolerans TaxID=2056226 RepID=A0A2M9FZJ2_9PROT|nr:AAA family ATPase [Minwuia thermotolerans]PJK28859.1 helicase DnaB [Minwuia thermotolerans]